MTELKKLPVDKDTLKLLNYDPSYYTPIKPSKLHSVEAKKVVESAIKFFYNQLNSTTLKNKNIIDKNIKKLKIMAGE